MQAADAVSVIAVNIRKLPVDICPSPSSGFDGFILRDIQYLRYTIHAVTSTSGAILFSTLPSLSVHDVKR